MPGHDIIVIGASAGGVEALRTLVHRLPRNLPAAVFVVLHVSPQGPSLLPQILERAGPLPARHAEDGAPIEPGCILIAPPDRHLLLEPGRVRVVRGPKENRHRPAVDPLFRSAARAYGPRVIGVVLTGALDDGTSGLHAVKQRGGLAVVQDPSDALYPSMPQSALNHVAADYVVPLVELGALLAQLVATGADDEGAYPVSDDLKYEDGISKLDPAALASDDRPGEPSIFSCPECGGVLYEIHEHELARFRCRVGHAFSVESMFAEQSEALEEALWTALNTLEESAALARRMARQAREQNRDWLATRFAQKEREAEQRAEVLRQVLLNDDGIETARLTERARVAADPELPAGQARTRHRPSRAASDGE